MKASHAFRDRRTGRRVSRASASSCFTRLRFELLEPRLLLDSAFWLAVMKPLGAADRPFDRWELTFSEAVDETTLEPTDVTLSGPGGDLHPLALTPLGDNRYEADFPKARAAAAAFGSTWRQSPARA